MRTTSGKLSSVRRTGVLRGSQAARFIGGVASPWDPDIAARRAAERATNSALGNDDVGARKACEHPQEAYKDMRYRSYDTVCPVCQGEVTPSISLNGTKQISGHPTHPCQTPDEAYMDARYRKGDTVCPVCHGWLPQKMKTADDVSDGLGRCNDGVKVWGQPDRWRRAGKGELWRKQGLHVGHGRATVKQHLEQEIVPHSETNPAQQYELGCKLEREGDKATRPVPDRKADLLQAAGYALVPPLPSHLSSSCLSPLCISAV